MSSRSYRKSITDESRGIADRGVPASRRSVDRQTMPSHVTGSRSAAAQRRMPTPGAEKVFRRFENLGELQWVPSQSPTRCTTDFCTWVMAKKETPVLPIAPTTTANCWEAILLVACHVGVIDWRWLHDRYLDSLTYTDIADIMSDGKRIPHSAPDTIPVRGDFVFFWRGFNTLSHVGLATGAPCRPGLSPEIIGFRGLPGATGPSYPKLEEQAIVMGDEMAVVTEFAPPPW